MSSASMKTSAVVKSFSGAFSTKVSKVCLYTSVYLLAGFDWREFIGST